jgi:hypothetical protein
VVPERLRNTVIHTNFSRDSRKRRINDVEQDLRKLGIRNWRSRAGDR